MDTFESLYNRYVGKVYKKCLSMTKDAEAAQDFTQDIFLKVFDKLDSFQSRSAVSTWLYSITHNYCLDQIRIGKRLTTETLSDELDADMVESESTIQIEHRLQTMEGLMLNLPAEEVKLLRLKYEQGWSIKAISQHYNLKESAVKMRLKRSRDKLITMHASIAN